MLRIFACIVFLYCLGLGAVNAQPSSQDDKPLQVPLGLYVGLDFMQLTNLNLKPVLTYISHGPFSAYAITTFDIAFSPYTGIIISKADNTIFQEHSVRSAWSISQALGLWRDQNRSDKINIASAFASYQGQVDFTAEAVPSVFQRLLTGLEFDTRKRYQIYGFASGWYAKLQAEYGWGELYSDSAQYLRFSSNFSRLQPLLASQELSWTLGLKGLGDYSLGTQPLVAHYLTPLAGAQVRGAWMPASYAHSAVQISTQFLFPLALDPGIVPGLELYSDLGYSPSTNAVWRLGALALVKLDSSSLAPFSQPLNIALGGSFDPLTQQIQPYFAFASE